MARRLKPGTFTGVLGDRAAMNLQARRGFIYANAVSPASALARLVNEKTGSGSDTARPLSLDTNRAPEPSLGVQEAGAKAFTWSSPRLDSTSESTSPTPANVIERYALLIGVAVLGFMLIRGR